jgi:hypothetical protein
MSMSRIGCASLAETDERRSDVAPNAAVEITTLAF